MKAWQYLRCTLYKETEDIVLRQCARPEEFPLGNKPLANIYIYIYIYRLCGLVVRVSGYIYRGPGFDPRHYQIFWVVMGLERGPLNLVSLVRSIEELLEWKK